MCAAVQALNRNRLNHIHGSDLEQLQKRGAPSIAVLGCGQADVSASDWHAGPRLPTAQ